MIPLPESELSAIAARADAATPGPWFWNEFHLADRRYRLALLCPDGDGIVFHQATWGPRKADRAFLAAARSDVPALVAEVRRLQAAVEALTPLARLGLVALEECREGDDFQGDEVQDCAKEFGVVKPVEVGPGRYCAAEGCGCAEYGSDVCYRDTAATLAARALLATAPGGEGEPPRPTDHGGEG